MEVCLNIVRYTFQYVLWELVTSTITVMPSPLALHPSLSLMPEGSHLHHAIPSVTSKPAPISILNQNQDLFMRSRIKADAGSEVAFEVATTLWPQLAGSFSAKTEIEFHCNAACQK